MCWNANMLLLDSSKLVGTTSCPLMGHEDTSLIAQSNLEPSQNTQTTCTFSLARSFQQMLLFTMESWKNRGNIMFVRIYKDTPSTLSNWGLAHYTNCIINFFTFLRHNFFFVISFHPQHEYFFCPTIFLLLRLFLTDKHGLVY